MKREKTKWGATLRGKIREMKRRETLSRRQSRSRAMNSSGKGQIIHNPGISGFRACRLSTPPAFFLRSIGNIFVHILQYFSFHAELMLSMGRRGILRVEERLLTLPLHILARSPYHSALFSPGLCPLGDPESTIFRFSSFCRVCVDFAY